MPLTRLLVEGNLDVQLLQAILAGHPVVEPGGSKNSLAPQTRSERRRLTTVDVAYIRDRDYDVEPPDHYDQPIPDRQDAGSVLGWRWCRHEIENYLLEPPIVSAATGCEQDQYVDALLRTAETIRDYQIARWLVGIVRRELPPNYELRTRPSTSIHLVLAVDRFCENRYSFRCFSKATDSWRNRDEQEV